ncbi:MAG: type II secretion system GspH family protein [Eubacterium sp.]|jgi:prepilin-type N-terminal cleavage/methylation domain-containing protein|nr:type II secretion system GspH family protein [Eubacterium sp.]
MKNKKGFTVVELVVVIAIIGVMTAIIVPLASNDNAAEEANAKARSFYFSLQRVMAEYKLEYDSVEPKARLDDPFTGTYYLEIEAIKAGSSGADYSNLAAYVFNNSSDFSMPDPLHNEKGRTGHDEDKTLFQRLRPCVDDTDGGFFYAEIDGNYRVVRVYWARSALTAGDGFEAQNRVNGVAVGAFPFGYGDVAQTIFGS